MPPMNFPQRAFFTPRKSNVTGMSHKCHTNVTKCHKNVTQKSTDFWFIIRGVWGGLCPSVRYGMVFWLFESIFSFFRNNVTPNVTKFWKNVTKFRKNVTKFRKNVTLKSHRMSHKCHTNVTKSAQKVTRMSHSWMPSKWWMLLLIPS